jgi:hypothetical protein
MSGEEPAPTIEDVPLNASISEGRLEMCVDREPATVRLAAPRHAPLSRQEIHLAVEVIADGVTASLLFDAGEVVALRDALDEVVPPAVRPDDDADTADVDLLDTNGSVGGSP